MGPGSATTSRVGQDEPGYRTWYLAAPGARRRSRRSTIIWPVAAGRRHPADLAAAAHRDGVAGLRRPAVRGAADRRNGRTSSRRCATSAICDPGGRAGRSRCRSIATRSLNECAGGAPESAHKHYSAIDMVPLRPITREALMRTLVRRPCRARRGYQCRPRLLRLPALPRGQHQISPLEHGPGGRRRMPADRPARGYRERRPADCPPIAPAPDRASRDAAGRRSEARPRSADLRTRADQSAAAALTSTLVLPMCNTISAPRQEG